MKNCIEIKKLLLSAIMILFVIVSIMILMLQAAPGKSQDRAVTLKQRITREDNTERIDYLDENGNLTVAADLGYATIIKFKGEKYRVEHFYDDQGKPVSLYPGYYALRKEINEAGYIYHITYLDQNDMPVITKEEYSDKYLTFYDTGKIKTEKYYDTSGNPVFTSTFGCGYLNEYDENGRNYKTTYLDEEDRPAVVGLGYAMILRNFYETESPYYGKPESEFYFDENGKPKALSLGQYGVHKEYDENGQMAVLTYLDEEGKPIITRKGYTTIVRSYHADNRVATEQYYDIDGNPFSLSEGQYGIKQEDNQLSYLDQNGNEAFNLKRFLYNKAWIIIPGALVIVILSAMMNRKLNAVLLLLYITVIIYMTLVYRENARGQTGGLLWQYRRLLTDHDARTGIIRNIWLFIPLGAILYRIKPKGWMLLVPIVFSILIEVIQSLLGIGFCELDDIFSNSLGGLIGFGMEKLLFEQKDILFNKSLKFGK